MLAQRTKLFSNSGTAKARMAAKAAVASGKKIFNLAAGELWCDTPESVKTGAIDAIEQGVNRYTDTIGLKELREAIAQKLSVETADAWDADQVAVGTGGKQALLNAVMTTVNPGDEVLIPAPCWTTFPAQVKLAGATPVFVETRGNGYIPTIADIRAAVTPATRAIIVNTPTNPTGAVFDRDVLAGIANLAIEHDFWVIFDECYGRFVHEPNRHENIVAIVPEVRARTLIVNAFSKTLALTGWRLGYLAGPNEVIAAARALQSHTTSCPNVIAQHAVLSHLQRADDSFEQERLAELGVKRARGLEILAQLNHVPLPPAQGGFYFYLDLSELIGGAFSDADAIASALLEAGVSGVPGSAFGDPAGLRFSYGVPLDTLERALCIVVEVLNGIRPGQHTAVESNALHDQDILCNKGSK